MTNAQNTRARCQLQLQPSNKRSQQCGRGVGVFAPEIRRTLPGGVRSGEFSLRLSKSLEHRDLVSLDEHPASHLLVVADDDVVVLAAGALPPHVREAPFDDRPH